MISAERIFDTTVLTDLAALREEDKLNFIRNIWPDTSLKGSPFDLVSSEAILTHIVYELNQVRHHGRLYSAQTFDEMFDILRILKQNISSSYGQVIEALNGRFPTAVPEMNRRSVELAIRIWLTINIHTSDIFVGPISAGEVPVDWPLGLSLEQLLRDTFGKRVQVSRRMENSRFDPLTTVAYLVNTCGMRLRWTDDIASHLKFDVKRVELTLYRHKACLISHLDGPSPCPIPRELLEEVLDTLDLLLPPWDEATNQLLLKEGQQSLFTLGCRKGSRELDVARYQYFGDQLEYLFESFDKTPRTWKQLALDRRNKLEWSAFWVTVMVAFLTLVSIPCNIIQATYSVKAYNVALAQAPPR